MARRFRPRSALASGLRRLGSAAYRAAALAEPSPERTSAGGLPSGGSTDGGVPAHWAEVVAARAPGLLAGVGVGTGRGRVRAAARPPSADGDPVAIPAPGGGEARPVRRPREAAARPASGEPRTPVRLIAEGDGARRALPDPTASPTVDRRSDAAYADVTKPGAEHTGAGRPVVKRPGAEQAATPWPRPIVTGRPTAPPAGRRRPPSDVVRPDAPGTATAPWPVPPPTDPIAPGVPADALEGHWPDLPDDSALWTPAPDPAPAAPARLARLAREQARR
ncbi:hypothetical protein [Cryptosporangium phraense]|uniref:Uncharacterized protein n=1 Tax=Cryptosporangium phraense TaxID=2593070 RepID=A0A545APX5_9ACTN|nr:hypothetical protein [Cryptosporangium phraense]TQS43382.1 hypothetical protein FL583_19305 [Cryptosporangium phraense]